MAMASSTALWLSTGSDPGRPRQTGQTLVLGSSPNMLRAPAEQLGGRLELAVHLEPDHHLPPRLHDRPAPADQRPERGRCRRLHHRRHLEQGALGQGRPEHLHADRQPVVPGPKGMLMAG